MKRTVVDCDYCYNKSIIAHSEDDVVLFCPHCGEAQGDDLEELDFDE
mgnify:CR=1 FL=1